MVCYDLGDTGVGVDTDFGIEKEIGNVAGCMRESIVHIVQVFDEEVFVAFAY